jgi:hypothetical protein
MSIEIKSAEDITYESLHEMGKESAYTDHLDHFKTLFSCIEVDTFLEWGCGFSSKIFLDNSKKVISLELMISEGQDGGWLDKCRNLFANYKPWDARAIVVAPEVRNACIQFSTPKPDVSQLHPNYMARLSQYFHQIVELNKVTVSFVDSLVYTRGDLAEISLRYKIPVVVAHDTACAYENYPDLSKFRRTDGHYGWFRINEHPEYERIFLDWGQGTTFWVHKDHPHVIETMKKYSDLKLYLPENRHLNAVDLKENIDYIVEDGKYKKK